MAGRCQGRRVPAERLYPDPVELSAVRLFSVSAAGDDVASGSAQLLLPAETLDFQQETPSEKSPSERSGQFARGSGGSTGRQHVIHDDDSTPFRPGIAVCFQRITPVFEVIVFGD